MAHRVGHRLGTHSPTSVRGMMATRLVSDRKTVWLSLLTSKTGARARDVIYQPARACVDASRGGVRLKHHIIGWVAARVATPLAHGRKRAHLHTYIQCTYYVVSRVPTKNLSPLGVRRTRIPAHAHTNKTVGERPDGREVGDTGATPGSRHDDARAP